MKRVIGILIILFLISGCTSSSFTKNIVYYNLDISDVYTEKIILSLSKEDYNKFNKYEPGDTYVSSEYVLLNHDIKPFVNSKDEYYNKKIEKRNDYVDVILSYNYSEKNFLDQKYIDQCFENYSLKGTDDYFEISLSGEYHCNNIFDSLIINVTNNNYVIDTNGTKTKKGYTWTIDKNNSNDVNIYYKFSRDYNSMSTNVTNSNNIFKRIFSILTLILLIIIFIVLFKIYKKFKYIGFE